MNTKYSVQISKVKSYYVNYYSVQYYQIQVRILAFPPWAPLPVVEMARLILYPLEVPSAPLKRKSCSHLKEIWVAAEACSWVVEVACFWMEEAACSLGVAVAYYWIERNAMAYPLGLVEAFHLVQAELSLEVQLMKC